MKKEEIVHIKSISELCRIYGLEKPANPLINIMDISKWKIGKEWINKKLVLDLYYIALKDKDCGIEYGRNTFDFDEGVLMFVAPTQVITLHKEQKIDEINGWALFFHPDLIRNTPLGKKIDNYRFFSYDVHEALHLSETEQKIITDCTNLISLEINSRIDNHSQTVITSTLELLLNYSLRFYERQFHTRSAQNSDVISQFQTLLKKYYDEGSFQVKGIPLIDFFAGEIHLSSNYLSDLLKKHTGLSAKEHINNFIIEKAKTILLSEAGSVNEIAYSLGFNYPHYFSRMFKAKTGLTPNEYRQQN